MAAAAAALQARGGRAHLRRAPRGLGGHGPPRLRRCGVQRTPHLALRTHELAQFARGRGRPADPATQASGLRQPAPAPRSASPGRGARDARLHVERAHRVGIRPRYSARAQRLQRLAGRLARPLRRGLGDHPPRVDRRGFLVRGPVLVLSRRCHLAAARADAASARVGTGDRQQGNHRVGGTPQRPDHPGSGADPRPA